MARPGGRGAALEGTRPVPRTAQYGLGGMSREGLVGAPRHSQELLKAMGIPAAHMTACSCCLQSEIPRDSIAKKSSLIK